MQLYTLLRDRASINILKILYDNEAVNKKYTMLHSELTAKLAVEQLPTTVPNLVSGGLISAEKNGSGETVFSITKKGKQFV
ncbi:hypothetical protein KY359_05280, partial [Candidatus Woesearchaeota archaeon]|nr:hypothetical protein [Candidatus Woesearchaeota archaeon]